MIPKIRRVPYQTVHKTIAAIKQGCGMLLGFKYIEWPNEEYAKFHIYQALPKHDLTYPHLIAILQLWVNFFKALIDRLPEGEMKSKSEELYQQLTKTYAGVLKEPK